MAFCLIAALAPLSGCVPEGYAATVTEFEESSDRLTGVFHSLLVNANITEENHFIDSQVFAAQPIDPVSIQGSDILTPNEIKLRISAIRALADYTTALATLASGQPAAQIQIDANNASASLQTLSADAASALAHPTEGSTTPNFSGAIGSAVSAIGEVIALVEKRRGEREIRESLRKNDPQLRALFELMSKESRELYARQRLTLRATGVILFHDYDVARRAQSANSAVLMELSDRIKRYRRDTALIDEADPSRAIQAFQRSHDALVEVILAPKEKKKESLAQLIGAVKAFASEVTPLAEDIYAVGRPS